MVHWSKYSWVGLAALFVFGVLLHLYGQMLGALLLMTCGSLRPPFQSLRCAQPYVATVAGGALSVLSGVALLWRFIRTRYRSRPERMTGGKREGCSAQSRFSRNQ